MPHPASRSAIRLLAWCAMAVAMLGAPACTASQTPIPTPSTQPTVSAAPELVPDTAVPTDVPNDPALREAVTITTCEPAAAGWRASGTAENTGGEELSLTITVFFTAPGGTVLGTGETEVTVAAGASGPWEVEAELTPADPTNCVLRGVG